MPEFQASDGVAQSPGQYDTPTLPSADISLEAGERNQVDAISSVARAIEAEREQKGGLLSPWLYEMDTDRPIQELDRDIRTDVTVIGAGISGIMTAYHLMKETDLSVTLCEAKRLASGATGNNAGQLIASFDVSMEQLVAASQRRESDPQKQEALMQQILHDAYRGVAMYEEIIQETGVDVPLNKVTSYSGITTIDDIYDELEDLHAQREAGIAVEEMSISETIAANLEIDEKYRGLYKEEPHDAIQAHLKAKNGNFLAASGKPAITLNSALFSEKLLVYMQATYGERVALYEETPADEIRIDENGGHIRANGHTITTEKVVICTNGYTDLNIVDTVDPTNKDYVTGMGRLVGYMAGYIEPRSDASITTLPRPQTEGYTYATTRPFAADPSINTSLFAIGGPYKALDPGEVYDPLAQIPEDAMARLQQEATNVYNTPLPTDAPVPFAWQGVMGFSESRLRMIGPTPTNKNLILNTGCNGIGLALAAFGGYKVARQLAGESFPPSLFDPVK